jgi:hypothetical protein
MSSFKYITMIFLVLSKCFLGCEASESASIPSFEPSHSGEGCLTQAELNELFPSPPKAAEAVKGCETYVSSILNENLQRKENLECVEFRARSLRSQMRSMRKLNQMQFDFMLDSFRELRDSISQPLGDQALCSPPDSLAYAEIRDLYLKWGTLQYESFEIRRLFEESVEVLFHHQEPKPKIICKEEKRISPKKFLFKISDRLTKVRLEDSDFYWNENSRGFRRIEEIWLEKKSEGWSYSDFQSWLAKTRAENPISEDKVYELVEHLLRDYCGITEL